MKLRVLRTLAVIAAGAAVVSSPIGVARAVVPVVDKVNWVQNFAIYLESFYQTSHQLEMVSNQAQNLLRYGSPEWGEVATLLQQLQVALQTGQSIAHSMTDLSARFQERFPGFTPAENYPQQFEQWSATALDTLRGVLVATGMNAGDVASVQAALDRLRSLNESATGRMQALQVANMIASHQVEELAKLRHLMAATNNAHTVYLAAQESRRAAEEAAFERFVNSGEPKIPTTRPGEGFGRQALPTLAK